MSAESPAPSASITAATAAAAPKPPLDPATIYARVERDLTACYATGLRANPSMTDAKLTLNVAVDASGTASCVIPSDHAGLTQEVEDCLSARIASERLDPGAPRAVTLPLVIRDRQLVLGPPKPDLAVIESVETMRMADAFDALEALEPAFQSCVQNASTSGSRPSAARAKSMLVAARVATDGRPSCALTSSAGTLAPGVAECATAVLKNARFPPPKNGTGIVVIPMLLAR